MLPRRRGVLHRFIEHKPVETTITELIGTYCLDYGVVQGDRVVRSALNRRLTESQQLAAQLPDYNQAIAAAPNRVERRAIERQYAESQQRIAQDLENYQTYTAAADPLLQEYATCARPSAVTVGESPELTDEDYRRIDVIERWLHLAGQYIPVRVCREVTVSNRCPQCEMVYEIDGESYYCPGCKVECYDDFDQPSDAAGQIAPKKKNYDLVANLAKTYDRLQGTSDVKIPYAEIG